MANISTAIAGVLRWEDSTLAGKVTTDGGGRTRFGIAEKFHPTIALVGFYDTMTPTQALGASMVLYLQEYCLPLEIQAIANQELADKLLSLGVNIGLSEPIKWLQEAVGAIPDGSIGPATLAAIQKADAQKALEYMKHQAVLYYQADVKEHPANQMYLNGWIARANA